MACASLGNCSSCAGLPCTGGCTGCGGICSSSDGCQGTCQSCTGGCGGTCRTTCSGNCDGDCSNCSGNGCSGSCGSGCSKGCGTGCQEACNKTCDGGVQDTNFANLILTKRFDAANIQNIANFIKFEVENRRGLDATELTFSRKEKLDETKIQTIINNLKLTGQTVTATAPMEHKRGYKALALDIIEKAKAAYNTLIPPNG